LSFSFHLDKKAKLLTRAKGKQSEAKPERSELTASFTCSKKAKPR